MARAELEPSAQSSSVFVSSVLLEVKPPRCKWCEELGLVSLNVSEVVKSLECGRAWQEPCAVSSL